MKPVRAVERCSAIFTRFGMFSCLVTAIVCAVPLSVAFGGKPPKPEIDAIAVDASASAPLLALLSRDHSIVPIETPTSPTNLFPVLIGPGVLNNQNTMDYVIRVYRAGWTVGIVNATQDEVNRFEELVEGEQLASCKPFPGDSQIALYGLQQATTELPGDAARYCLPFLPANQPNHGKLEQQWLDERFAATPPLSASTVIDTSNSINLDSLAEKTHCSFFWEAEGSQTQLDTYVNSLRSFDNQRDYYYVTGRIQFRAAKSIFHSFGLEMSRPYLNGDTANALSGARLSFTEPDTALEYVSSYTNSKTTTVGGSAGFSATQGPNVSVSGSYTIGTSETTTVPPMTIENRSSLSNASPRWVFFPANPQTNLIYSMGAGYVWSIDRDVYDKVSDSINSLGFQVQVAIYPIFGAGGWRCEVPPPFATWDVNPPVIASLEPTSVQRGGGTFLIHGSEMYPGIVSNVLLGGDALNPANFSLINDREIRVVVPSGLKKGSTLVQVNTNFNGSTLQSNSVAVNIR